MLNDYLRKVDQIEDEQNWMYDCSRQHDRQQSKAKRENKFSENAIEI